MSIYNNAISLAARLIPRFANPDTLVFQERASVSDGMGGTVTSWSTKFSCEGAVLPLSASEKLEAMKLGEETSEKAYVQFSSGTPTADDRLLFKGSIYNVTGVLNIAEADAVYVVFLAKGVAV